MHSYLKQSTASQTRILGPFVDDGDFKTLEEALTIANTDVKISKNGAASVDKNSGGGTHIVNGNYAFTFDATDTGTVGEFHVSISVAGALVVVGKFWVLEEAIYDAFFASSASGFDANQRVDVGSWDGAAVATPTVSGVPEVDLTHVEGTAHGSTQVRANAIQVSGSATAADNLEATAVTMIEGTVLASPAPSTTTFASSGLDATDDHYNGRIVIFTSGVLQNQSSDITDYTGSNGELTVTAMTEAPSSGDTFRII